MPRVKSRVPSSPSALATPLPSLFLHSSIHFTPLTWLKTALKTHQNSPLMSWQAINLWSPKLQIAGDVTHFGSVGWQECTCLRACVCV